MKKLLNLLLSVLIIISISMCSSPTDSEKETFQEYVAGNFLVTSENEAEFIGEQSLQRRVSSGDTLYIAKPGDQGLTLRYDTSNPGEQKFRMFFTDSTITTDQFLEVFDMEIEHPVYDGATTVFFTHNRGHSINDERMRMRSTHYYNCDPPTPLDFHIKFHLYEDNGDHFRSYKIPVTGLHEVLGDIVCSK